MNSNLNLNLNQELQDLELETVASGKASFGAIGFQAGQTAAWRSKLQANGSVYVGRAAQVADWMRRY